MWMEQNDAALTWIQADGHLLDGTGKTNKQSDGMAGRQNKTRMMICCHDDVVLFTKNGIKFIKYNYFVSIILCNYSSNSYKMQQFP